MGKRDTGDRTITEICYAIFRHARRCDPSEEPHALARTCGSVRGARGNPGPYRDDSPAEQRERRPAREGKSGDSSTRHAQKWASVSQRIERLREFVKRNPEECLTTLLHHVNVASLEAAFYALKRKAAPGVDGVTWEEYTEGLEDRLAVRQANWQGIAGASPVL